jgi:tellurite resistance protein TerC
MTSPVPLGAWLALGATILVLLIVDLFGHRGEHGGSRRAALIWTIVWIAAGLLFNLGVWATMGAIPAQEYLASYLIEKSLSVDNLFVFLIVFSSLNVPPRHQHRVLFWGIFGALVFRAIFIFAGVAALESYQWVSYVFGGILLFAAWRAWREHPAQERESGVVKFLSRHLPVSRHTEDGAFIRKEHGRRVATPLLLALCAVELTDIVFAIDSVPAALSVSRDRFIVFSSNAFAILGLRALYTVLARTLENMRHLHYGLAGVLAFAAFKLISSRWLEIPPALSIGIIVAMIGASVLTSLQGRDASRRADARPPHDASASASPLAPKQ